ncbi:hypothetical protein [Pseudoduganella violacea]|uniref:Chromosome partitioning protein ParB n=1 Tax=Pseudoduganella violacea TaxID=1715466 RepID=A0A7W5FWL6_9BURK|nr:hypothetical protein [Pseudoduganella violacea]MBB3122150.1 hypothetical protein [Pseudoduganella violacea]
MARQIEDARTGDLLDGSMRQRGRPITGKAMTGAERQAARRARLAVGGKTTLTVTMSCEVVDFLSKFVRFKDLSKDDVIEGLIRKQLMRKR